MKTIKSIKKTKEVEIGEIKRVDDKTAHNMVGPMWEYISKSEWKNSTRNQVGTKSEPSQDKVEKKKNPKQELADDGKEFVKTRKKSK
jgi:hypothetical protein